ncbi:hypothetical protein N8K70_14435 [Microbacterium betulae]|uniref:Uncharacterized protein n=1 Tax=Microbacterium betulae TaxID=2981139 RepID=A0AA97I6F9_9MICO|nr:hypothetical protein [Microbacterium sp. AB]WOF22577.1 hypothetical protein N8K70_14435 [Microbacterium sp. AB]
MRGNVLLAHRIGEQGAERGAHPGDGEALLDLELIDEEAEHVGLADRADRSCLELRGEGREVVAVGAVRVRRDLRGARREERGDNLAQRSLGLMGRKKGPELDRPHLLALPRLGIALEPERLLRDDRPAVLDPRLPAHRAVLENALLDHLLVLGCASASIAETG